MKTIHLARGLTLPAADLATEVVASLGQRGSGKSNGAAVVAEGLLAVGIQVIVLDHVGIHFSLRLDADGKHPSPYQIPVLGGQHGDIGLVATTGGVVAEALARSGSSAVLDVSAFSKGDRCRFAADFAEAFFAAKKLHPGPVQILLEEAQRYVPQKLFAGQGLERMLGAFEEIAEVGRNYGVGLHLISQRPQKINKDVLNLADTVLAYRANGVLERKAISEWVQEKGAEGRKEMHDELPGLPRGTAIVWSPNRSIYGQYAIELKSTYDAGATPTHARAAVKTKRLDLDQLEEAMGAAVEQAKANDPRALRAEIERLKKSGTTGELEREIGRLRIELEREKEKHEVEREVVSKASMLRLERLVEKLDKAENRFNEIALHAVEEQRDRLAQAQQAVVSALGNVHAVLTKANGTPTTTTGRWSASAPNVSNAPRAAPNPNIRRAARLEQEVRAALGGDVEHLPAVTQRMLAALRQGEAMGLSSMPFKTVAHIAGVSPTSGTTSNRKGTLTSGGYITTSGPNVQITEKGRAYPIDVELPPADRDGLLAFWKREIGTDKVCKMLDFVVLNGRATNEELAAAAEMSSDSGTFSNYKGVLTGRGLMVKEGRDYVPAEAFNR